MSVEITSRVDLDADQVEAIERGLNAVGVSAARVVVTMELAEEVRRLGGMWAAYGDQRGGGMAGAKTIVVDGQPHFFLSWRLPGARRSEYLERLLVHEGAHALMAERGEGPDWEWVCQLDLTDWQRQVAYCAWMHADEYRAELGAGDVGYPPGSLARRPSFDSNLLDFGTQLLGAFYDPRIRNNDRRLAEVVLTQTNILGKHLAYLSAQHRPTTRKYPLLRESQIEGYLWSFFVGKKWRAQVDWLRDIPSAREQWSRADIRASLEHGLRFYRDWMEHIGFVIEGRGGDWQVSHCRGRDDWVDLESRLGAEFDRRGEGA